MKIRFKPEPETSTLTEEALIKTHTPHMPIYSMNELVTQNAPILDPIIGPRVLPNRSLLLLGGSAKVGKSDFLLSLVMHMAAGVSFLDLIPIRPLRILYVQTQIDYHDLRERLVRAAMSHDFLRLGMDNLLIAPPSFHILDEDTVQSMIETVEQQFGKQGVDLVVLDSGSALFDGGTHQCPDKAASYFLQQRLMKLRNTINPELSFIITQTTDGADSDELTNRLPSFFAQATALSRFYTTGMILNYAPGPNRRRELFFEIRNGPRIASQLIENIDGLWKKVTFQYET